MTLVDTASSFIFSSLILHVAQRYQRRSYFEPFPRPLHQFFQPRLKRHFGFPAQNFADARDVGQGFLRVAMTRRTMFLRGKMETPQFLDRDVGAGTTLKAAPRASLSKAMNCARATSRTCTKSRRCTRIVNQQRFARALAF